MLPRTPDRALVSVPDRRVVLGLQCTIRRDGAIGQGRLALTETTVRRAREALFRFGVDHTFGAIDADLCRAADHDELQTRCTRSLGRPVRLRDRDEQARLMVMAAQRSLVRPSIASVLELGDHQIRWSGVLATRVVYGRVQLGVADLVEPGVDPFTATGIAAAVLHRRWGPQRPELEATHVTRDDLETLRAELVARPLGERLLVPGIDPAETDHVAVAVAVAIELTDRVGADGIVVTRAELFHGQVLQILDALTPIATPVAAAAPGPAPAPDPGEVVARLAGELFEQLAGVHGLGPRDLDLLQRAARLHANDPVCGRGAPHRRAARALLDNGLRGLCPEQLVEVACLVRFQRGRDPGQHFPLYGRLPADRRRAVDRLTALLRLAMGLDAGRDGAVERILVDVDPELACIHVFGDRPLDLVIHATRSCLSGIQRLLGVDVVVRAAGPVRIDH